MNLYEYALKIAKEYYEQKIYEHALRVAGFVAQNDLIDEDKKDFCIVLAIMHDLCEDTEYKYQKYFDEYYKKSVDQRFKKALAIITKDDKVDYLDYIKNIKNHAKDYPEVYWVKIADMRDHLEQTDTLTDKLKEKYLAALPYLL